MITAAAGNDAGLVFTFDGPLDGSPAPTISIVGADATIAVASTSTGLTTSGSGRYTYVWSVPSDTTQQVYTASVAGDISTVPVLQNEFIAVTNGHVYVGLDLIKQSLGYSVGDTEDDNLLLSALVASSRAIEKYASNRRFYPDTSPVARVLQTWRAETSERWGRAILIPDLYGEQDTVALAIWVGAEWQTLDNANWELEPYDAPYLGRPWTKIFVPNWSAFPYDVFHTSRKIQVTGTWGWPATPDEIVQATLLQTTRLFRRKDSPQGVMGDSQWGLIRVSSVDPDIQALLRDFKRPGVA